MKTLREVRIGETAKVVKLHGEGPVKRRIMDMASPRVPRSMSARWRPSVIRWRSQCAAMNCRCARRIPK